MTLEEVKQIPMRDVVERYGFTPNRAGFIHCPFHSGDKGASLKIYKKDWYCHACGAGKDQIDFVMRMDDLSFKEAFQALGGNYGDGNKEETRRKIRLAEAKRQKRAEEEAKTREQRRANNNYITALRNGVSTFPPFSAEWCFCQDELAKELYRHDALNGMEGMP